MKKIVFVGGMDKLDIIIYSASIIYGATNEEKNCLVIDMTKMQKSRYIIPSIEFKEQRPNRYITTYQNVDVAVGYTEYDRLIEDGILENYEEKAKTYDYVFIDVDSKEALNSIPFGEDDIIFFTTTMDIYSVEKTIESLEDFNLNIPLNRLIFGRKINMNHLNYINFLAQRLTVKFTDYILNYPYDNGDLTIIHENQKARRLNIKPFSKEFKNSLIQTIEIIVPELDRQIGRYIKILEKTRE